MAIITSPTDSRLRLMVQTGTDPQGNPVVATRNYSRIKAEATDESVPGSTSWEDCKASSFAINRVNR